MKTDEDRNEINPKEEIPNEESPQSPFDVPGIKTQATTEDILEAIRESRERTSTKDDAMLE
jgi:hypothetical protein